MDILTSNGLAEAVHIITGGSVSVSGLSEHERMTLMRSIFCTLKKTGTPAEVTEFAKMFNIDENEECDANYVEDICTSTSGLASNVDSDNVDVTPLPAPLSIWVVDDDGKSVPKYPDRVGDYPEAEYDYTVGIDDSLMVASEQQVWDIVNNLKDGYSGLTASVRNYTANAKTHYQVLELRTNGALNAIKRLENSRISVFDPSTTLERIVDIRKEIEELYDTMNVTELELPLIMESFTDNGIDLSSFRHTKYKQVKQYFMYIKSLQERLEVKEKDLSNTIASIQKKALDDTNAKVLTSSNKELISFDDKSTYLDGNTPLYVFDDIDSAFVLLDGYDRYKRYDMLQYQYRDYIAGFTPSRIIFDETGSILNRQYIIDLFESLEKNYDLDSGSYVVEDILTYKVSSTAPLLNSYNIAVPSRVNAIQNHQVNIYKDIEVVVTPVDSSYYDTLEANRIDLEKENYINSLITNANDIHDDDWESEYFKFKSNHLDQVLSTSLSSTSLEGLLSLININSVDVSSDINTWLLSTFVNKVINTIDVTNLEVTGDIMNTIKIKTILDDGSVSFIDSTFNIYEYIITELRNMYSTSLNSQLYPTMNNLFITNNIGIDVNLSEYRKVKESAIKLGVFYSDDQYSIILKNRIIETNPNPSSEMDVKFIRIPYNSQDKEAAILNATNDDVYTFDEITGRDPYWKATKQEVLLEDFNAINSKYYSVENTLNNYVNVHKVSHMLDYLVKLKIHDPVIKSDTYKFTNSAISSNDVSVIDGLIGANVLLNRMMGVTSDTIFDDSDMKYIYGYNNDTSTDPNIYDRLNQVAEFRNVVVTGTPTATIVGDMADVYVGQILDCEVNGTAYTGIIHDVTINYSNPSLSSATYHEYGSHTNNYNFTPAILESAEFSDITFILTGVRVDGSTRFLTADYINDILVDYHAGSGNYNLPQDLTEYKFTQFMQLKMDVEQIIPTITDPDIYASLLHFHKMQTTTRYSRKLFEISPGVYHDTYMDYIDDNVTYDEYASWLRCEDVEDFNTMSENEQKVIYKNKLIEVIDSMIDYIDNVDIKGYFNGGEYQYYMKNMIRTVLMYFKSYTVDIMDVKTTYNITNPMDGHVKTMDSVKILDTLRKDDVIYNKDGVEIYRSYTSVPTAPEETDPLLLNYGFFESGTLTDDGSSAMFTDGVMELRIILEVRNGECSVREIMHMTDIGGLGFSFTASYGELRVFSDGSFLIIHPSYLFNTIYDITLTLTSHTSPSKKTVVDYNIVNLTDVEEDPITGTGEIDRALASSLEPFVIGSACANTNVYYVNANDRTIYDFNDVRGTTTVTNLGTRPDAEGRLIDTSLVDFWKP